jgi:hypothetical protein
MSKISELSDGGSLVSTDYLIAVRSGGNVKVRMDEINVDQVDLGDNEFIRLGNSQDLTLVHNASNSIINQAGIGDLLIQKAGSTKLTVNSTGIDVTGTVTADGLTVSSTGEVVSTISSTSTSGARGAKLRLNVASTGGDDPAGTIEFTYGTGYTVAGSIAMSHTNPAMKFLTGTTERMRIANTGQLLVGSGTSPASGEVKQTLARDGSSYLEFQNTSANTGSTIGTSGENFIVYTNSGALGSETYTERMRIDSSGRQLIGYTSSVGTAYQTNLQVKGSSASNYGGLGVISTNNEMLGVVGTWSNGENSLMIAADPDNLRPSSSIVFTTDATERMRINASGNVGINASSPSSATWSNFLQVEATYPGVVYNSTAGGTNYKFSTGVDDDKWLIRDETAAATRLTVDASGNLLVGKTAVDFSIDGVVAQPSGVVGVTRNGGAPLILNRKTSDGDIAIFQKDGAPVGSISSRSGIHIQIQSAGDTAGLHFGGAEINPVKNQAISDNTIDLGQTSYRFDDIYATNGTIQTSDRNEKQDIEALSDAEQRVAVAAKGLLRKFRWKSSVAEKGDEARTHFGIIAQDLQAAFEAEGLDAGRYAMFINSTWTDEETGEERSRMGVRYSELLAFVIAAI